MLRQTGEKYVWSPRSSYYLWGNNLTIRVFNEYYNINKHEDDKCKNIVLVYIYFVINVIQTFLNYVYAYKLYCVLVHKLKTYYEQKITSCRDLFDF